MNEKLIFDTKCTPERVKAGKKHRLFYYDLDGNWVYCIDCGLLKKNDE